MNQFGHLKNSICIITTEQYSVNTVLFFHIIGYQNAPTQMLRLKFQAMFP